MSEESIFPTEPVIQIRRNDKNLLALVKGARGFAVIQLTDPNDPEFGQYAEPDPITEVNGQWSADLKWWEGDGEGSTFIAVNADEDAAWTHNFENADHCFYQFGGFDQ